MNEMKYALPVACLIIHYVLFIILLPARAPAIADCVKRKKREKF